MTRLINTVSPHWIGSLLLTGVLLACAAEDPGTPQGSNGVPTAPATGSSVPPNGSVAPTGSVNGPNPFPSTEVSPSDGPPVNPTPIPTPDPNTGVVPTATPAPPGVSPAGTPTPGVEPTTPPFFDEPEPIFVPEITPPDDNGETPGIRPGDKVDLLFVVDNSASMGDKQAIFRDAIPDLINMLVSPPCLVFEGLNPTGEIVSSVNGVCSGDNRLAFQPVNDIHIGAISSSLGDHGLGPDQDDPDDPICPNVSPSNDAGHLIGLRRNEEVRSASYNQLGFLVWDPQSTHNPPGDTNVEQLVSKFQAQVAAIGENGCGFEAPLESAYRFLVDPEPYERLIRVPCSANDADNGCVGPEGIDTNLLAQRTTFLRPDSQLVVLYLTDENDCSIRDSRQGYFTLRTKTGHDNRIRQMVRGTNTCQTNPNDSCCHSCAVANAPEGCPAPADNGCVDPLYDAYELDRNRMVEALNVRCFDQKRRFGVEFLYSVGRYVAGFKNDQVPDRANAAVPNPLFAGGRRKNQVFVVGIVGTPWQDIAVDWQNDPSGRVERALDLDWDRFLPPNGPTDPFNAESIVARSGTNPVTGATLGGPGTLNDINGHEREIVSGDRMMDDLQFACIFPLAEPRVCSGASSLSCDCVEEPDPIDAANTLQYWAGNPLCRNPETGEYGTTQYFAKAYPGPRVMEVVRAMGNQGVLGSICPKNATNPNQPDYGYRPPVRTLLLGLSPLGAQ